MKSLSIFENIKSRLNAELSQDVNKRQTRLTKTSKVQSREQVKMILTTRQNHLIKASITQEYFPNNIAQKLIAILSTVLINIIIINVLLTTNTCQATGTSTSQVNQQQHHQRADSKLARATSPSYLNNFNLNLADDDYDDDEAKDGLYLLGLFDVHAAANGGSRRAPFKCGPIDTDAGETSSRRPMQNMWAFLWAIEQVNGDESLLPGVKLGSLILDTCSSFLRTNQQLANLLHHEHLDYLSQAVPPIVRLPRVRQFLGVVADQYDWQSVEATASMASSLGLATFVTQSRSTKLSEFARSYGHHHHHQMSPGDEAPARKPLAQAPSDERLLRELLGIGRMLPEISSTDSEEHIKSNRLLMIRMAQNNEIIADALASLCEKMRWDLVSVVYDGPQQPDLVDLHDELIRQLLLRNIQLGLDEQIANGGGGGGDITQSGAASANNDNYNYERLLVNLARQAQIGSRVVISLLSIGSARQLQARLHQMRKQGGGASTSGSGSQLKALNSLLWITTADREPYYTYATDSLGVISASSSSSLLPEFKQFYDGQTLELGDGGGASPAATSNSTSGASVSPPAQNRWWPEYVRTIMQKHKRELGELLVNECAHWQEPRASPLQARCAHLNLSSLVQTERSQNQKLARRVGSVDQPAASKLSATTGNSNRLSLQRYLASGWEHNGMEVINSVLAIANGLESVRQSLCPETQRGLCAKMRDLLRQEQVVLPAPAKVLLVHDDEDQQAAASSIKESGVGRPGEQLVELPTLSELIHSELIRSTFQLADGQMFSLADSPAGNSGVGDGGGGGEPATSATNVQVSPVAPNTQTQLDARLKFYNLRFLRPNSIGFVKFAQFGGTGGGTGGGGGGFGQGGLTLLNATKALHYTNIPMDFNQLQPIERVQSTCQDERKCLMLSSFLSSLSNEQPVVAQSASPKQTSKSDLVRASNDNNNNNNNKKQQQKLAISEEELAQGVNSLFKLSHPLLISSASSSSSSAIAQSSSGANETNLPPPPPPSGQSGGGGLEMRTMRLKPVAAPVGGWRDPFASGDGGVGQDRESSSSSAGGLQPMSTLPSQRKRQFEVIVLLPLSGRRVNIAAGKSSTGAAAWRASCPSGPAEEARSFQHLAALAYGQARAEQLAMALDKQRAVAATQDDNKLTSGGDARRQQVAAAAPFELTISVIDYCDHSETMAAAENGGDNLIEQRVTRLLAGRLSARVRDNNNINNNNGSTSSGTGTQLVAIVDFDWRVSQQVEAIVGESSVADNNKQPVHLTIDHRGHHHSATMAAHASARSSETATGRRKSAAASFRINLLPNKQREISAMINLIKSSFPAWSLLHLIYAHDQREFRDEFIRQANEAHICVSKLISIPTTTTTGESDSGEHLLDAIPIESRRSYQLERTRALFKRELYDFRSTDTRAFDDEPYGLNSTRLLVVLASESAATNKLVLEAASESMLQDYVWLTSHEWLESVELPAERGEQLGRVATQRPRLFLSTKLESFEGHDFRLFFNHLTPALHAQLPTDWFDRFWQSHFNCSLPVSSSVGSGDRKPRAPPCEPRQQLDLDQDHDHHQDQQQALYTIRAIEALQLALDRSVREPRRPVNLARDFRLAFDSGPEALNSAQATPHRDEPDPATPLVGFHIVHRLVSETLSARRANSRQLDSSGQLVRVGATFRKKSRIALAPFGAKRRKPSANRSPPSRLRALLADRPIIETSQDVPEPADQDEQQEFARIGESLEYLAGIDSHCVSNRTCRLCERQVSSARELRRQEEAHMRLESSEARAISPLQWFWGSSNIESEAEDMSDDDQDDQQQDTGEMSNTKSFKPLDDDIQAAASSLFSARTSEQVASELRRARWHSAPRDIRRRKGTGASTLIPAGQPLRRLSGAFLSVLSLVGVLFTVASMTYFYPNLLDRQHKYSLGGGCGGGYHSQKLQSSFRSTSSSTCNIITADGGARLSSLSASGNSNSLLNSILTNLTDYLMLTGLLMLYSINIAFLLPATMRVCWFRRIGLALSYTLLFSSILAKIHEVHARQPTPPTKRHRRQRRDTRTSGSSDSLQIQRGQQVASNKQASAAINRSHQSLESVDESVEVTFESLPHESEHVYQAEQHQQISSVAPGFDQNNIGAHPDEADSYLGHHQGTAPPSECAGDTQEQSTTDYFRVPLALIVLQLVVALTWLIKQPPEPTLFHACWHCASLMRSPLLFLYEPLMSLLEPAAILVVSWLWSIVLFNRAFSQERQFTLASRGFLSSQPLSFTLTNGPEYTRHKHLSGQLTSQLRDSKLLVITTTLLVLLWSLMTLNIVTSSQSLLGGLSNLSSTTTTLSGASAISRPATHLDDQSLLYTNLASGALVFALLFVHRLRLFCTGSSSSSMNSLNKCDYDQISSSSSGMPSKRRSKSVQSISRRLKSFGRSRRFTTTTTTTTTTTGGTGISGAFDQTLAGPNQLSGTRKARQAERLKLQQFNMTYGTYSPTTAAFGTSTSENCADDDQQVVAPEVASSLTKANKNNKRDKSQVDRRSGSSRSLFKLTGGGKRAGDKNNENNKSETGGVAHHQANKSPAKNKKSQRQVGGSFSSSRNSLSGSLSLADDSDSDLELELPLDDHLMMERGRRGPTGDQDNLSCASNATSQLQGNDLYPIDCSIQLVDNIGPPPPPATVLSRDKQPAEAGVSTERF